MPRPAKPDPMIATPTSRTAEWVAGVLSSVLVTDRLLRSAEQRSTSYNGVEHCSIRRRRGARMPSLRRSRPRTPLTGAAVLITGAARGIGAALARKAAARGARVALVGLEPEELARVADELGPEHLWVEADVTDPAALAAAVQRAVDTFGGLDVVVANAGIAPLTTV